MNNKGADQTARMRRLICTFVVRIWHKTHFFMARLICFVEEYGKSSQIPTFNTCINVFFSDSPSSELHLTAGYVNSSAIAAEIFRITRNVEVTDVLVAIRLNNSQLLHNRLYWRPELLGDLKVSYEPRHEKTCLRGFRPGKTQTGLLSYRD